VLGSRALLQQRCLHAANMLALNTSDSSSGLLCCLMACLACSVPVQTPMVCPAGELQPLPSAGPQPGWLLWVWWQYLDG
jgi:hypothetical protein